MAYVTIRMKNVDGYSRSDLSKDRLVLGRSSKTDLPIKHTSISREHCAFVRDGETWLVEDLGSSNGTWVNKVKVIGKIPLKERDIVKAGQARLTFHAGRLSDEGEADVAVEIAGDDDAHDSKAPNRTRKENDPPEAIPCAHCASWFSFAHRLAGDTMSCPRCGHANIIPSMSL
jgi:predicted component of type VI protein secretion system